MIINNFNQFPKNICPICNSTEHFFFHQGAQTFYCSYGNERLDGYYHYFINNRVKNPYIRVYTGKYFIEYKQDNSMYITQLHLAGTTILPIFLPIDFNHLPKINDQIDKLINFL